MGKKTLYLDLDACDRLEEVLHRLPGRPSLSSFLSDLIPRHADAMERMVAFLERDGVRGVSGLYLELNNELGSELAGALQKAEEIGHASMPLSEVMKLAEETGSIPPKKRRKS